MVEKIVKYGLEDFRTVKLYNVKVGLQRRMLLRRHKICRGPLIRCSESYTIVNLGPVVQRWISAHPGLKFNPLFWFMYFCTAVDFNSR